MLLTFASPICSLVMLTLLSGCQVKYGADIDFWKYDQSTYQVSSEAQILRVDFTSSDVPGVHKYIPFPHEFIGNEEGWISLSTDYGNVELSNSGHYPDYFLFDIKENKTGKKRSVVFIPQRIKSSKLKIIQEP